MPRDLALHAATLTRSRLVSAPVVIAVVLGAAGCAGSGEPGRQHGAATVHATHAAGASCRATMSKSLDPVGLTVGDVWPDAASTGHVYTSLVPTGCGSVEAPAPFCAWLNGWDPSQTGKALLDSLRVVSMNGARLAAQDGGDLTEVLLTMPSADAARRLSDRSQSCLGVSSATSPAPSPEAAGGWITVRALDNDVVALSATGVPAPRAESLALAALNRAG